MSETPRQPASAHRATVFLVDDDSALRDAVEALVTAAGYRFQGFASAECFLQYAAPWPPCCLVFDIELPGMSGLALQQVVAERFTIRLPVVFLSAGDSAQAERALRAGARGFVCKPCDPESLLAYIERALH